MSPFPVCLLVLLAFLSFGESVCPNGWMRYNDSCYLFKNSKLTWHDAKTMCDDMSSQLASIETAAENGFLIQTINDIGDTADKNTAEYWVGGNDMAVDGDWVWEAGSNMTFTDWAQGEPNGGSSEQCLGLYGLYNFHWNDDHCSYYYRFICEMPDPDGDTCPQDTSNLIG